MKTAALQVLRVEHSEVSTPAPRGHLLTATQVATEVFNGTVSAAWVRRQVPHKIVLGHSTVRWFEYDVRAWIETQRALAQ